MIVGILKEIKTEENRVSMTPAGVEVMKGHGHTVLVEKNAGVGSGFDDKAYAAAGAKIVKTAKEVYDRSDMVMHVKEPMPSEYELIRKDQIVFTYFHLAANEMLTKAMIKTKSIDIAYETIQKADGSLPLLIPMSEVAGRMAIQEGAKYLEMEYGGEGVLLGGVPGVDPATVLVIGAGTVGTQAAKMACGLGAKVYVVDSWLPRLRYLNDVMPPNCFTLMSSPATIRRLIREADLVIGSVLIPGAKAPKLVTRDMLKIMKKGVRPGGRGHRSGRLFRNLQGHDAQGSDLHDRRHHPLLRGKHAGRRRQDLHAGPDQCHPSLCGRDREQGLEEGDEGKSRNQEGSQCDPGSDHLQGRGRCLRHEIHAG